MKKCLVVVDYQNDFVSGSLGFDKAKSIEHNICKKILEYIDNGFDIIYTFDTHDDDYLQTSEGINLPVKHCIKSTLGHELYGEVKNLKRDEDKIFYKDSFGSLEFGNYISFKAYDSIEFVGLISNICVISNVIIAKSALKDASIIVDSSCTASYDESLHKASLDVMKGLYINVI